MPEEKSLPPETEPQPSQKEKTTATTSPPQPPKKPKKLIFTFSKKWITIELLLLIVIFVLATTHTLYRYSQSKKSPPPTPTPIPLPTANPTQKPFSDWKTYTNHDYSFRIKYPSNWIYLEQERNYVSHYVKFSPSHILPSESEKSTQVNLLISTNQPNLESYLNSVYCDPYINCSKNYLDNSHNFPFGGSMAQRNLSYQFVISMQRIVLLSDNKTVYEINTDANLNATDQNIFYQILSTFEFLPDEENIPTPKPEQLECINGGGTWVRDYCNDTCTIHKCSKGGKIEFCDCGDLECWNSDLKKCVTN